jgi:flagellar motor switch protein FliN/FliY
MSSGNREFGAALVEELAIVVGALIDVQAQVGPGAPIGGPQWNAEIIIDGAASGSFTMAIDAAGASTITALMMGIEEQVPTEAVIDSLREVCSQAVSALSLKPIARGAKLRLGTLTAVADLVPEGDWAVYGIAANGKLAAPLMVGAWGSVTFAAEGQAQPQPAKPAAAAPRPAPAPAETPRGLDVPAERIDVILDIDLPLVVRFGRTELPLKSLTRIGPGSLIDLGRSPDDPVEILVSNRVVARGEVVIVSGNYGIRILDVVSPRDRMRSLEG